MISDHLWTNIENYPVNVKQIGNVPCVAHVLYVIHGDPDHRDHISDKKITGRKAKQMGVLR